MVWLKLKEKQTDHIVYDKKGVAYANVNFFLGIRIVWLYNHIVNRHMKQDHQGFQ